MRSKYGKQREGLEVLRPVKGGSFTWNSLNKASNLLRKGCAWNIHNGKGAKFWRDVWLLQVPLTEVALQPVTEEMLNAHVADYVDEEGSWDIDRLEAWLPPEVLQKITANLVDPLSLEEDTILWTASSNGHFSTSPAYSLALPPRHDPNEKMWRTIWKLPVAERVRCFVWLVSLGRIATNALRYSRKCAESPMCLRCGNDEETILHFLRDCYPARFFWLRWIPQAEHQSFFSSSREDWVRDNILKEDVMESGMNWNSFFSTAVWCIWKNRCTGCFQVLQKVLSAPSLAFSIQQKAILWHKAWQAPTVNFGRQGSRPERIETQIHWSPPRNGWVKLNVDGASAGNPGIAGAGGSIRDEHGKWIRGFVAKVGEASATLAELWAIYYGLHLARKAGYSCVLVESDSQLAIALIKSRHDPVHPYAALLASIRRCLAQDWLVSIGHVYREGNRVADWLSKHSLVYPLGMHELVDPPPALAPILMEDCMGISFQRRVVTHPSSSL
ncbi:unnamed protein product [Linum trigynum]|uniref:RNase H type-1 domain-containing protein n=1 Tax=Linum trigynum TaxID=586398 RepID=A0AAV2FNY6_9ROSI